MDVAISAFRADLSSWIDRVGAGEEVVITERGEPVARLVAIDSAPLLARLVAEGVLSPATGRPRTRVTAESLVQASGSVSALIGEQRR